MRRYYISLVRTQTNVPRRGQRPTHRPCLHTQDRLGVSPWLGFEADVNNLWGGVRSPRRAVSGWNCPRSATVAPGQMLSLSGPLHVKRERHSRFWSVWEGPVREVAANVTPDPFVRAQATWVFIPLSPLASWCVSIASSFPRGPWSQELGPFHCSRLSSRRNAWH